MLATRLIQVAGVFFGALTTVWVFLYLFRLSMKYGEGLERATLAIPAVGLLAFLYALKRHARPGRRWAFLEFFASSLTAYLVMQFIVVNLI